MRKIVLCGVALSALLLVGCDEKSSGGAAPATSATGTPASSSSTTSATTTPSASPSAAEKDKENKEKPEAPKDHAARAKALSEAFATHEPKKLAALYSEDAVVKTPGTPDVKGRAAIEKGAEHMFGVFKDAKLTIGRVWVKDKHTVAMESLYTGTNTGDAPEMGIPKATNKPIGVMGAMWLEVGDDGLIKEEHRYWDMTTAIGQLNPPDPKNPVRPVIKDVPNGTETFDAKDAKEEKKEAKEDKKEEKKEEKKEAKEENKVVELEKKGTELMSAHKVDEALKMVADDYVFDDYTTPAVLKGKKPYKELVDSYLKAFPDMKASIDNVYAVGDYAIVELHYTGTQKGALGPIKATNKPVDLHQFEVDSFKDGKLVRSWAWGNNAELLGELGLMPKGDAKDAPPSTPKTPAPPK